MIARDGVRRRRLRDRGELLVEIVLTVMVIGVAVTALVSALATSAAAGASHRESVRADTVMRNYAEATKGAAGSCVAGGTYTVNFQPPSGFAVAASPNDRACPAVTTTKLLTLSVTSPTGVVQTMQIRIRTP